MYIYINSPVQRDYECYFKKEKFHYILSKKEPLKYKVMTRLNVKRHIQKYIYQTIKARDTIFLPNKIDANQNHCLGQRGSLHIDNI